MTTPESIMINAQFDDRAILLEATLKEIFKDTLAILIKRKEEKIQMIVPSEQVEAVKHKLNLLQGIELGKGTFNSPSPKKSL